MIHSAAIMVSVVSGTFALVAMLVGSPLSFGLALALCGTGWIVTHFVERIAEQDRRAARRRHRPFAHDGLMEEGFVDADFVDADFLDEDVVDEDFLDTDLVDEGVVDDRFALEARRRTRFAASPLEVRRCEELQDRRILLV
ncbi:DNA translocase ftsK [Mycobacterium sp. PO2]|nr:DNA translocase ftsK [Mycobacterium sp. PO2]